jgi:hypothetical protein
LPHEAKKEKRKQKGNTKMTDRDYHARNLDALLDSLYTTLNNGYSAAMFDPKGKEEAMLSSLYSFLEEHITSGFVRVADKVRHNEKSEMAK